MLHRYSRRGGRGESLMSCQTVAQLPWRPVPSVPQVTRWAEPWPSLFDGTHGQVDSLPPSLCCVCRGKVCVMKGWSEWRVPFLTVYVLFIFLSYCFIACVSWSASMSFVCLFVCLRVCLVWLSFSLPVCLLAYLSVSVLFLSVCTCLSICSVYLSLFACPLEC